MYMKPLGYPLPLKKLEVILPRLHPKFPQLQEMEKDLASRKKGYIGEKKVDYYLKLLPQKFVILQDVCLEFQRHKFQIDNAIHSQYAIYLVESKNYNGKITFDTILKQLIRSDGKIEEGYRYPITQSESHKLYLQSWLHERNFHDIPIIPLVGIADPTTIIDVIGDRASIARTVVHAEYLPHEIMKMDEKFKQNNSPRIQPQTIGKTILNECTEFDIDIVSQYGVKPEHLYPGVHCPNCGHLRMKWIGWKWTCPKCQKTSKHAHWKALADYFLLFKPTITNSEARYFLQVNCRHQVKRLLADARLEYVPEKRVWRAK
ncbi:nuclease-related domain-containing protein [Ornithinibacillus halophilus]|uniref:Nuclease-related domain-containing protein n=1 Tax=Ornithinibacillus halophilus TaxID=930117 RepID=A0A1M5E7U3_9BACI|nr:nuclease-related domain-containing protein [Ornithinibacillus halophilus]SHF75204.1 Nuclease-related domain-containing protein [Ornithinibacillus halophilus]